MSTHENPGFVTSVVTWIGGAGLILGTIVSALSTLDKLPPWLKDKVDLFFGGKARQQPQPDSIVREEIAAELKEMQRLMHEQDQRQERELKDERCRAESERKTLAAVQSRQQEQIDYLWTAVGGLRQYGHRAYGEIVRLDPETNFPRPPHVDPPAWSAST